MYPILALVASSAALALTSARAATGAPSRSPLPVKERVAGYIWLNTAARPGLKGAVRSRRAGPRQYANKFHLSSDPVTVAKWLASHADINSELEFVASTNPVGLRLMRPRIRGFLHHAVFTGFGVRGKP